jgi:hypothetical protein
MSDEEYKFRGLPCSLLQPVVPFIFLYQMLSSVTCPQMPLLLCSSVRAINQVLHPHNTAEIINRPTKVLNWHAFHMSMTVLRKIRLCLIAQITLNLNSVGPVGPSRRARFKALCEAGSSDILESNTFTSKSKFVKCSRDSKFFTIPENSHINLWSVLVLNFKRVFDVLLL